MSRVGGDPEPDERVAAIRQRWSSGDYPAVGARFVAVARDLVDAADVGGMRVLDAACGPGSVALAAAWAGASSVVGVDLTPRLLELARQRGTEADVDVDWREGDLHDLPVADAAVDLTLSSLGAFTSDDPPRCAAELARVTRPGGTVGVTAWRADGLFGDHAAVDAVLPPALARARAGGPRPYAWADTDGLAAIIADAPLRLRSLEHHDLSLAFASVEAAVDWFLAVSGPILELQRAVEAAGGDLAALRAAFIEAWSAFAEPAPNGDGVVLTATYGLGLLEREEDRRG